MNFLNTVAQWARNAWSAITGAASDPVAALGKFWSYVTSLHGLLGWLFGFPLLQVVRALLSHASANSDALAALLAAIARLRHWIWVHEVVPVYNRLHTQIGALRAWTAGQLRMVWMGLESDFSFAIAWTNSQVAAERRQRIGGDAAERAAMLTRVTWALQQVQKQASSGYNTATPDRKTIIRSLLTDLAGRDPAVRGLVSELASLIVDIETIDNPLVRYTVQHLLSQIIRHLGIDQAISDLISRLIGPLAGDPRPGTLYDVEKDVAARLTALEGWVARFMAAGGPEVEQAGQGWKDLTGLAADAAILGFVGLAVTDPAAWATGVNDTIGTAAATAMTGIVDLISRA